MSNHDEKKLSKFDYALLTANLFMANVPCDSSYDRKMGELLADIKKAHEEELREAIGGANDKRTNN